MAKLVKILWTGGFDSSCRMIQLSKFDITVQPYYLVDAKCRRSIENELNAISQVKNDIEKHPETRCVIKPLIKADVSELTSDKEIKAAHRRMRKKIGIGMQYEWLAGFALRNPGIELCLEREEGGPIFTYFNKTGALRSVGEGVLSCVEFDKSETEKDLLSVFGNFRFPLSIRTKTKLELVEEYKRLGFEDTMYKTWFCHNPIKGEPCGTCNPCKAVVSDGLQFRMPPAALKRHAIDIKNENKIWFRLWKKIRWRLKGY